MSGAEGRAWRGRLGACGAAGEAAVAEDVALVTRRLAAYRRLQQRQPAPTNLTLHLHTTEVRTPGEVAGRGGGAGAHDATRPVVRR